jgi:hypothetical protein
MYKVHNMGLRYIKYITLYIQSEYPVDHMYDLAVLMLYNVHKVHRLDLYIQNVLISEKKMHLTLSTLSHIDNFFIQKLQIRKCNL